MVKNSYPKSPSPDLESLEEKEPAKPAYRIRTMEGDLRRLLGEGYGGMPPPRLPKEEPEVKTPKEEGGTKIKERVRIFLERYLKILIPLVFGIPILILLLIAFMQGGKENAPPPSQGSSVLYHAECRNQTCVRAEGEGEDTCKTDTDCSSPEAAAPEPRLPVEYRETLFLKERTKEEFSRSLALLTDTAAAQKRWPEDTLVSLSLAAGLETTPASYLNLEETTRVLGIRFPQTLASFLEDYSLFLYTAGAREQTQCDEEGVQDATCWGPRLILVLKHQGAKEAVSFEFGRWETTLFSDVSPLILSPRIPEPSSEFKNFFYRGQLVRYQNLALSTTALNYAIRDSLVIIGTSKESMFAALDALL